MQTLTLKNGFTDLLLLIIFVGIQVFLTIIIFFISFPFMPCGDSFLHVAQGYKNGIWVLLWLLAIEMIICAATYQSRTRLFDIGCWIICFCLLIPMALLVKELYTTDKLYTEIDPVVWQATPRKPFTMVRSIYEEQAFIGMPQQEFASLMGIDSTNWHFKKENELAYQTDAYGTWIIFNFQADTLHHFHLYCND